MENPFQRATPVKIPRLPRQGAPAPVEWVTPERRHHRSRQRWSLAALILISATGVAVAAYQGCRTWRIAAQPSTPMSPVQAALGTWTTFVQSRTVEERLQCLIDPVTAAPDVRERWDRRDRPDPTPATPGTIAPGKDNAQNPAQGITQLLWTPADHPAGAPPIPIFFQTAPDGRVHLDWSTYREQRDNALGNFIASSQPGKSGRFHAMLSRLHFLANGQADHGIQVRISTLSGESLLVPLVVPPDHPDYAELDRLLTWSGNQPATLELQWHGGQPADRGLRLQRIVSWDLDFSGGTAPRQLLARKRTASRGTDG